MGGSWVCGLWGFGEGRSVVWSGDGKGFRVVWLVLGIDRDRFDWNMGELSGDRIGVCC